LMKQPCLGNQDKCTLENGFIYLLVGLNFKL
jgi:hypothetical protein